MAHPNEMPQYVIDRIMAKRGKLEVFDHFEPEKTALVVIDMQNFSSPRSRTQGASFPTSTDWQSPCARGAGSSPGCC